MKVSVAALSSRVGPAGLKQCLLNFIRVNRLPESTANWAWEIDPQTESINTTTTTTTGHCLCE